jgi:hypothetical protein
MLAIERLRIRRTIFDERFPLGISWPGRSSGGERLTLAASRLSSSPLASLSSSVASE